MIGLALKEIRARRRRLAGALTAVFLGVAFLTGTLVLGDTLASSLDSSYSGSYGRTDVVVRNATDVSDSPWGSRGEIDAAALDRVRAVDGVAHAAPLVQGSGQVLGADGRVVETRGPRDAGNWITDPALNPYRVAEGRAPRAPDEVVVNRLTAELGGLRVGDRTAVLTPRRVPVTIVGISTFGDEKAFGESAFTAFTLEGARRHVAASPDRIAAVRIRAADGTGPAELAARVGAVLPAGAEAVTADAAAAESLGDVESGMLGTFRVVIAAFGGVALLVAAFTIHNTFAITVAQRTRESALLRVLGADRRQVLALVGAEALAVGTVATAAGLAGGVGFAALLRRVFAEFRIGIAMESLAVSATTPLIAVPVGVLVTLAAALGPALRASRTAPLTALRDAAAEPGGPAEARAIIGGVFATVAAGAVVTGAVAGRTPLAGAGALLFVLALVVLGPVGVRPAAAAVGGPAARLRGVPGAFARANACRSPRRTAGAATALMIGVGVVSFCTVFVGSLGASLERGVAGSFTGRFVVDAGGNETGGFDTRFVEEADALPQTGAVAGLGTGTVRMAGEVATVSVADPSALRRVLDLDVVQGALADPRTFAVSEAAARERGWRTGSRVPVTFADGASRTLTVGAVYAATDLAGDHLVPRAVWEAHGGRPLARTAFVAVAPGVPPADARRALTALAARYGAPDVRTRDEFVASRTERQRAFLPVIYGMLGLAIVVALLGIANTLSLAVHERTRELGLLRAVGATRAQVRSIVRWESVIVALFGTAGGLLVGVFLGWGVGGALGNPFAPQPVPLAVIALGGAAAGTLAAVRPARRAARAAVLTAVAAP
ncbi:ABC transporter permease [Actinomadura sp. WAC 06369]|uniref:ABC transporter permease n=1 Tax=Actinomadura sp. WAC 06369 TaxID=2203193 RepID=UPI000F7A2A23|nr:FtsX-like permease family protein [Actinomadura sp. WAC 06369]RSN50945.1 ABC transporter substrate-binding protein [Actinomadura sp. WAC 06369]